MALENDDDKRDRRGIQSMMLESFKTEQDVIRETRDDPTLREVLQYMERGWPACRKDVSEDIKPLRDLRRQLTLDEGTL